MSSTSLSKGPISIEQALRYAAEIAGALDAAHKRGIVHRDLKPGNIIITKTGTKLLDFGLAKLAEQPTFAGMEATHTVPLTGSGSIVGTLNYMAPEQLEGGVIDTRTDIFAFGGVLFEMLTGRRAFNAQSHAGLIAAILNEQTPSLDTTELKTALPISAHRALERLIRKCLAKDPDDRWQSAADLAAELRWIDEERVRHAGESETAAAPSLRGSKRRERLWMTTAIASVLAAAGLVAWTALKTPAPAEPVAFEIDGGSTPLANGPGFLAVSPDGRHFAMATGNRTVDARLIIRSVGSVESRVLTGTDGAWQPVWSPDSRHLAFMDRRGGLGTLKRIDANGGAVVTLAHGVGGRPAWSSAGIILIDQSGSLWSLPDNGGPLRQVTTLDKTAGETGHHWPQFLPDGRRFLFRVAFLDRSKNAIFLGSLDSPERTAVLQADSSFELSAGHILYQREGTVFAQRFDADQGRTIGDPRPIIPGVHYNTVNGRAAFSASASGETIAYRGGDGLWGSSTLLQRFEPRGKPVAPLGEPARYRSAALSPDGSRLAVMRSDADGRNDIYVIDVERNLATRLTSDSADETNPVWSHDSAWIYFASTRNGSQDLYRRSSSGGGNDELILASPEIKVPTSVAPDGKVLLMSHVIDRANGRDIWGLPLSGERKPFAVITTKFNEEAARFSPDGKWIAYHADDLDDRQVYVEPFPTTGQRVRISTPSGGNPFWGATSGTIYYVSSELKVMEVDLKVDGVSLRPSPPRELFTPTGLLVAARGMVYDPRRKQFLGVVAPEQTDAAPVTVIMNWTRALLK